MGRLTRLIALLRDPRTPKLPRAVFALAMIYAVWPMDLVPELITPVFGFLDDLVLVWLSVRWLFRSEPKAPPTVDVVAQPRP